MSLQPLPSWHGWLDHFGYTHADPFNRPMPIPSMGIFDSPDVTICFNSKWSPLLIGALSRLRYPELYIVDSEHDGIWADQQATKLIGVIAGAENPCLPQSISETECAYYPSWYAGIEYIPHNPFSAPNGFDPLYPVAPFFRFSAIDTWFPDFIDDIFQGLIEYATGYQENDIFVSFFSLPTLTNPFDGLDYPTIKLTVEGTGKVSLKFLLVPFGGRVLISLDPPDIGDIFSSIWSTEDRIIELQRDILALPPETDLDAIEEIFFTEEGTHTIYATFLPTINDEIPLFQFGGGFRGYEVCGDLTVISPITGEPIDFTNSNESYQEGVIVATEQDLYNALVRFRTEESNRWLLASSPENIENDVEISKNTGSITIKQALGGGAVVDGTTQELHFGGVYNQAVQFKKLFDDMNNNIDSGYIVDTVINLSRLFTNAVLGNWALLVGDYFTADPEIVIDADELALQMFCHGYSNGALAYALNEHGSVEADVNTIIDFVADIPSATWDSWYSTGKSTPKDGFISASCYRYPSTSVQLTTLDKTTTQIAYGLAYPNIGTRNYRIEVSGYFLGTNGERVNAVHKVDADGVITRHDWQNFEFHGPASFERTVEIVTLPAYNASGIYAWTIEVPTGFFDWVNYRAQSVSWIDENFTGSINMTIHDLGAP